ncbi:MAG TPA: hypothetical protein PLP33_25905 [Leptospiraceae bacterium]|nr:hypothetical protein [Leptospiraceae bacterium]
MVKLSDTFCSNIKKSLLEAIQNEVDFFLNEHGGGKAFMPFYADGTADTFNYFLIEDLDEAKGFDGLDELSNKYLSEFEDGDHLTVVINGKTVSSVKFYISRGFTSLDEVIEQYGNIVGINHKIFSRVAGDVFKFSEDGRTIIFYNEEKKR